MIGATLPLGAVLIDQQIVDGVVQIRVMEGFLASIGVEPKHLTHYVESRVRLGERAKLPLNKEQLEDQLRLLKADPLFTNVEASFKAWRSRAEYFNCASH